MKILNATSRPGTIIKSTGFFLLWLVAAVGISVLGFLLIEGIAWLSQRAFHWIAVAVIITIGLLMFVFLPLAIFRKTRIAAAWGFFFGSYVFGLSVWVEGLLVTYTLWGAFWVYVGLFALGIGVVPFGLLATLFKGAWGAFGEIVGLLVFTFGSRFFAIWLEKQAASSKPIEIGGEIMPLSSHVLSEAEPSPTTDQSADDEFQELKQRAEQGNADAQVRLGSCYTLGKVVKNDETEAVKWWREAADQGNAEAQRILGFRYENGCGTTKDAVESVKWFRKAAEQGEAQAQYNLGRYYLRGKGVAQDATEAVKWLRKAAEQGYEAARICLGDCYRDGKGVPQDYVEAFKWYNLAADQGLEFAIKNRDQISQDMTREQIAEAQRRAAQFIEAHNNET